MRTEGWLVSSLRIAGPDQTASSRCRCPCWRRTGGGAGLTYAAFSLLGLFAPVLGSWADRTGRHRDLLIWGSVGAGVLLLPFGAVSEPLRIVLAAGAGLGVTATTTAGNVLAIQGFPEAAVGRAARVAAALTAAPARSSGCSPRVCWRRATPAQASSLPARCCWSPGRWPLPRLPRASARIQAQSHRPGR